MWRFDQPTRTVQSGTKPTTLAITLARTLRRGEIDDVAAEAERFAAFATPRSDTTIQIVPAT